MAAVEAIDGEALRRWLQLAAAALGETRAAIDALNVFPVPDADTGTNLHLTLLSAAAAVQAMPPRADPAQIWRAAADGAMLGACGNSGTIISQLLRGLSEVCGPASPCDGTVFARALDHAAALARAAVSRPAEGTVLTVAAAAALAARLARERRDQLTAVLSAAAAGARQALARTTGQLDVLTAHGVVDAGAAGFCVLLDALTAAVTGVVPPAYEVPRPDPTAPAAGNAGLPASGGTAPAGHGYEVTYLLSAPAAQVDELRERLDALGDSLVIVGGEQLWHVHVHVPDAGAAIEAGLAAGLPHRITVSYLGAMAEPGAHRAVVITADDGLGRLLGEAGALTVGRDGGPLPSVAAVVMAFRQAGGQVIAVPTDDRAAAVARSAAAALAGAWPAGTAAEAVSAEAVPAGAVPAGASGQIRVLDLRCPVQAIAAVAVHDPQRNFLADAQAMAGAAAAMRCGSVSPAGAACSSAAAADGHPLVVGQIAGQAVAEGADQAAVAVAVAGRLLADGGELVTLLAGQRAEPGLAERVAAGLRRARPELEIECHGGGAADFLLIGVE
jgi:DAK2 domain fusion protein YloV